jgi:hypothetical protein
MGKMHIRFVFSNAGLSSIESESSVWLSDRYNLKTPGLTFLYNRLHRVAITIG